MGGATAPWQPAMGGGGHSGRRPRDGVASQPYARGAQSAAAIRVRMLFFAPLEGITARGLPKQWQWMAVMAP